MNDTLLTTWPIGRPAIPVHGRDERPEHSEVRTLLKLARTHLGAGRCPDAATSLESAERILCRHRDPVLEALALLRRAELYGALARHSDALAASTRAATELMLLGDLASAALAMRARARSQVALGMFSDALRVARLGRALAERSGDGTAYRDLVETLAEVCRLVK